MPVGVEEVTDVLRGELVQRERVRDVPWVESLFLGGEGDVLHFAEFLLSLKNNVQVRIFGNRLQI